MAIGYAGKPYQDRYGAGLFGDLYKQFAGMGMSPKGQGLYTNYNPDSLKNIGYFPGVGTITSAMRRMYGTNQLKSSMFDPISRQMMKGMKWQTHKPQIEERQQSLLGTLLNTYQQGGQRKASGGFSGSSALDAYTRGIKDIYGKGMTETLANVGKSRAGAYENIQNAMQGWHQTAQQFVSGQ